MKPRTPMYRLVSIDLFRQLMQRTGDGSSVSVRVLAADARVHRNTIGNLLSGVQETVPEYAALSIAHRLGVDLLVLFQPVCRSTTTPDEYASITSDEGLTA